MIAALERRRPITVTVTGAAGQIGYSVLFRIAGGQIFGDDQPVSVRLLDVPSKIRNLEGVVMELEDCGYPLLRDTFMTVDPVAAFDGANTALLVGAHPRLVGMERGDLIAANSRIFASHGRALNESAADDIRIIVVGNPANTNALVVGHHAPDIPKSRITSLARLDHNRAAFQLARRAGVLSNSVRRMTIWGNHSATQFPDVFHASAGAVSGAELAEDTKWLTQHFIPTVSSRGTSVLEVRGHSSQASAARATVEQLRDWYFGTAEGDWTSAGVWSHGEYGVPEGLVFSYPVTSDGDNWTVVEDLELNEFSRDHIAVTIQELIDERDQVSAMGLI
ncbi:MAG: malate dehydrogenase [Cellulomonadaceae bacterium]|nr:malate dehydrogenase [Cellulomonadaceae bacterium]